MSEQVRGTATQAQTNLHAMLHLVAAGRLRCSQTTRRPAAATVTAIAEVLDRRRDTGWRGYFSACPFVAGVPPR
ncbi:hypothetical protein [Actinoplanes sp. NPDC049599]|uniref:hypothetical protein n=1 Tax=Actinoplanes sp. NPDC049599 TaxID=3363903 RepID=UPI00378CB4A7